MKIPLLFFFFFSLDNNFGFSFASLIKRVENSNMEVSLRSFIDTVGRKKGNLEIMARQKDQSGLGHSGGSHESVESIFLQPMLGGFDLR